jgi:probable HAF family extracellular repeat protein
MRELLISLQLLYLIVVSGCSANVQPVADAKTPVAPVAFQGLGDLPGGDFESHAYGVSPDGTHVVGTSYSKDGEKEAFYWTQVTGMIGLGDLRFEQPDNKRDNPPRRFNSRADAVSRNGGIIVGSGTPGSTTAFRWNKANGLTSLGSLPGRYASSMAQDISSDGTIVVGFSTSGQSSRREAFRWSEKEGMVGLGGIAPGGVGGSSANAVSSNGKTIVGESETTSGAFRWTKETGVQSLGALPPGAHRSQAADVSGNGGVVVGTLRYRGTRERGFRWTPGGGIQELEDLPGGHDYCTANAVSEDGSTIVGAAYSESGSQAVRWMKAGRVESIRQLLVDGGIDMTSWRLWIATDVSADGTIIVGYGMNPNKEWEAWRVDLSALKAGKGG